jgi:hypothetical protein
MVFVRIELGQCIGVTVRLFLFEMLISILFSSEQEKAQWRMVPHLVLLEGSRKCKQK